VSVYVQDGSKRATDPGNWKRFKCDGAVYLELGARTVIGCIMPATGRFNQETDSIQTVQIPQTVLYAFALGIPITSESCVWVHLDMSLSFFVA